MPDPLSPFVTRDRVQIEELPWGPHHWLCRPGIVPNERLALVRVHMPPGTGHAFHRHPTMEEIIYVVEGRAEQWVERQKCVLAAGEIAHIPMNVVHATFNPFEETLVFLAVLSPGTLEGVCVVDVSQEEPWKSIGSEYVPRPGQKGPRGGASQLASAGPP